MYVAVNVWRAVRIAFIVCHCALVVTLFGGGTASAEKVRSHGNFDLWTLYCVDGVVASPADDCSIVASVRAEGDEKNWVRIGFVLLKDGVQITIRTPRIDYFKQGVVLAVDGEQLARTFVDECSETWCDFPGKLDLKMLAAISSGKYLTAEYRMARDKGIRLGASLTGLRQALARLSDEERIDYEHDNSSLLKWVGKFFRGNKGKDDPLPVLLTMELRAFNSSMQGPSESQKPYQACAAGTAPRVHLTDISEISAKDRTALLYWIGQTRQCLDNNVVWIRAVDSDLKKPPSKSEATWLLFTKYTLYDYLTDNGIPDDKIVITDTTNTIPLAGRKTIAVSTAMPDNLPSSYHKK